MEMVTMMMKQMKDPINNLIFWLFKSPRQSLTHSLQTRVIVYDSQTMSHLNVISENIDIGSKALKEAAMIEAEMEEMNDQEDAQP